MSSDQDVKMQENTDTKRKPSDSKSHTKSHKKSSDKEKETSKEKDTKKSSKSKSSKSSSSSSSKPKEKQTDTQHKSKDKSKDKSHSSKKDKSKDKSKKKEDKSKDKSKSKSSSKHSRKRKHSLSRSPSHSPSRSRDYRHRRSHSSSRSRHRHSRYSRSPSHRSHRRHRRDRRRRRYKRSRRYHSRSISRSYTRSRSRSRSRTRSKSRSKSKSTSKQTMPLLNPNPQPITSDIIPDINNPNGSKVAEIKATAPNAMQQIGTNASHSIADPLAAFNTVNAVFGNLTRPAVMALTNPLQQSNNTLQQLLSGTNPYKLSLGLSGNISNINPLLMNKMAQELRNSAVQQQTASAAAKLNEVKKDMNDSTDSKTTDDSLFFQVHLPGMNTLTAIGGIHPQITRPARRLYVGNLPVGMGLTEQILTEFFSQCCKGLGIATNSPVLSVWLNSEQTFGFIEFRSVQDTNLALQLFEGLQLGGRQLRFGRPVDYKQPPDNLKNYVVGETGNNSTGTSANGSAIEPGSPAAMLIAQQHNGVLNMGSALVVQQDMAKKTLDAAIGAKQKAMLDAMMDNRDVKMKEKSVEEVEGCVLLLMNMVNEEDIKDEEEYNDILDDIECECENYGKLMEIVMPKVGEKGCGRVFLKFEKVNEAKKCKGKVDGRKFGDNVVRCVYFKEEVFEKKEYDCNV